VVDDAERPARGTQIVSGTREGVQTSRRLMVSPLRYPGGKGALFPTILDLIRANDLIGGTYVEPYAGGAGAGLALLLTGHVNRIVINDLDPAIYAFWRAITDSPDRFARLISDARLTVKEWRRQKSIYTDAQRDDHLSLGFATFYLNRTNRSGVLNGGPIGGLDQTGNYKIDARFNKAALLERLRIIALYAKKITVLKRDGLEVIKRYANKSRTFIYADPPYFEKAGTLYMNTFAADDHTALARCLAARDNASWILTYDDVPRVAELYGDFRREVVQLNYSAHRVAKAEEVMVFSHGVKVPWAGD
jgi:DNA adenine methylase